MCVCVCVLKSINVTYTMYLVVILALFDLGQEGIT